MVGGALGAAVFWLGPATRARPVPAVAALTVTGLATGGFHEDGLADSFDALAGGWTVEDRLRILKDSRHGTFGVLAIVLITAWKFGALAALDATDGAVALVVAHTMGRSAAVALMGTFPSARNVGLGADYTRDLRPLPTAVGASVGVVASVVAYGLWAPVVLIPAVAGAAAVGWWALRKIHGVTGDLLGAAEQVAEALVLVAAVWLANNVT
ncbi:MAG: adenosylcobinamide-GDP ribazoletransferase [Acidimicrobiales bacterium]